MSLLPPALVCAVVLLATPAHAQESWTSRWTGPAARRGLSSEDPLARVEAARRLGRFGEASQSTRALLERLDHEEDPRVVMAIVSSLAERDARPAVPALARWIELDGRSVEERAEIVHALGAIASEPAIRTLLTLLPRADVGDLAAHMLGEIGPPAVPHLLRALDEPSQTARAARALGVIGDTRASVPLLAHLQESLPPARIEILDAIGAIGDPRGASIVTGYLDDAHPDVVAAALRTLGQIGERADAPILIELADRGTAEQRAAALRTLVLLDPELAAPRARARLSGEDAELEPLLRHAVLSAILEHPSAPLVPVLRELAERSGDSMAAADALARVERGGGLDALLGLAATQRSGLSDPPPALDVALALGLRRYASSIDDALRSRIERHLAAADPLARCAANRVDGALGETLEAWLRADEAPRRALAAACLELAGSPSDRARRGLADAIERERDPAAFRAEALAAIELGAPIDPARIEARLRDPATAPEAMWLSALAREPASPRAQRRLRQSMRRALRSPDARTRAGAAIALALAQDRSAWRALVAAAEDEHDAVRLAAARALAVLAVPESFPETARRARSEREPEVRAALALAASAEPSRPPAAWPRGEDALFVRIASATPSPDDATYVSTDIMLADGRWLRVPALTHGLVLVPSLPAGPAEVQVIEAP
ncbi:MAG: HEAT repeat domain-containing protein [Sandaracinaceae bacterium]